MRTLTLNKQHLTWAIILGTIAALTFFFIVYNYKQQLDIQTLKSNNAQFKIIKSYIHYTEEVKTPINDDWTFYDSNMKQYTLDDIVAKRSQFCLFIDKSQCEVCWKRALTYLEENTKGTSLQPIILFSGFLPKDFVRLSTNLPFPCYYVESTIGLEEYFQTSNPMYFILNQAKFIHYVFYPEGMYDAMGSQYLFAITSYLNTYNHTSPTTMIIAENPQIEIKGLPLRKKASVKLYLQNRGNKSVKIQQVLPSCDCMLIEHYPTVVKAKDKATIDVSFVPDKKGWMQRSVTIILDDKQTIEFNIDIYVV